MTIKLDSEGFLFFEEGQVGVTVSHPEGTLDILYQRTKMKKWLALFFPGEGFNPLYNTMQDTFYPGDADECGGVKIHGGLEINWFDCIKARIVLVECYKPYMSPRDFNKMMEVKYDKTKLSFITLDGTIFVELPEEPNLNLFFEKNIAELLPKSKNILVPRSSSKNLLPPIS